jgi:hypothetical protein
MVGMAQWAVVIPAELWATERLFDHDAVTVPGSGPVDGDEVLLVAGAEPQAVALGTVKDVAGGVLLVAYLRRAFDAAATVDDVELGETVTPLDSAAFARLAARLGGDQDRRTWLVSLDLPIEAASPAEAVRQFWSYVLQLGPAELPTYVSPAGDELAMQAFVLGAEANQDPEEDDD